MLSRPSSDLATQAMPLAEAERHAHRSQLAIARVAINRDEQAQVAVAFGNDMAASRLEIGHPSAHGGARHRQRLP